jgi:hypothetical protein
MFRGKNRSTHEAVYHDSVVVGERVSLAVPGNISNSEQTTPTSARSWNLQSNFVERIGHERKRRNGEVSDSSVYPIMRPQMPDLSPAPSKADTFIAWHAWYLCHPQLALAP